MERNEKEKNSKDTEVDGPVNDIHGISKHMGIPSEAKE